MTNRISDINKTIFSDTLWEGSHKIPWNDPAFSARILKEHLSQDHNLASRKSQIIEQQIQWLHTHCLHDSPKTVLDLGCGPGLYATQLADGLHHYHGIDFSPASIGYAVGKFESEHCTFRLGDVTTTDFGGPYDIGMMLYGELNVFSPANCRRILDKAFNALTPGGTMLIEFQNPDTIQGMGNAPSTTTKAPQGGLFSDEPYVCLTENHWYEEQGVTQQTFRVQITGQGTPVLYRSTTKAWSRDEMVDLLQEAGFNSVQRHEDWPVQDDSLLLMSAVKR